MLSPITDHQSAPQSRPRGRPSKAQVEARTELDAAALPAAPSDGVSGDPLKLYLRDIGQYPLLKPKEEIELNKVKERGGDAGDAAFEKMVNSNLRLVVKIARDYEGYGLPILDLINEGNEGLMKAIEKFDHRRGAKISTYAAWWIKQSIKRALANQGKTIRMPVHAVDKVLKLKRISVRLEENLGRPPTTRELHEESGISEKMIQDLFEVGSAPTSLDAEIPSGGEDGGRLSDIIADPNVTTADAEVSGNDQRSKLKTLLKGLKPREQTILRYRFGLDGEDEETLERVGERFGVTRERIRQIEAKAIRTLRNRTARVEIGLTAVPDESRNHNGTGHSTVTTQALPKPWEYLNTLMKFWTPPSRELKIGEDVKRLFLGAVAEACKRGFSGASFDLVEVSAKVGINENRRRAAIERLENPRGADPLVAKVVGMPGKHILTVEGHDLFQAGASNPEARSIYIEALRSYPDAGRLWSNPLDLFAGKSQLETVFKALGWIALRRGNRGPFPIADLSEAMRGMKYGRWLKELSQTPLPGEGGDIAILDGRQKQVTLSEAAYSAYLRGFSQISFEVFRVPSR